MIQEFLRKNNTAWEVISYDKLMHKLVKERNRFLFNFHFVHPNKKKRLNYPPKILSIKIHR